MTTDNHKYTNRLIDQKSPYLLQHAHNPVNWFPWGEEALAKAREEDKPILFSCGYSTCHWCHVYKLRRCKARLYTYIPEYFSLARMSLRLFLPGIFVELFRGFGENNPPYSTAILLNYFRLI